MADNDTQTKPASYTITRRADIIERLAHMQKLSALINVKPTATDGNGFVTTIAKILPDKNLFAIDISEDAALNRALETCDELLFTATLDGIPASFKAQGLSPATLDGNPVFAAPIPKSLYWQQQRSAYRLPIPPATPMACTLLLPDLNAHPFPVLNVSQTGFSIFDQNPCVANTIKIDHVFQGCYFLGPSAFDDTFTAELCRTAEVSANGKVCGSMLGLLFVETTHDFDKGIQDLLYELAREGKRKNELTRQGALPGHFGHK